VQDRDLAEKKQDSTTPIPLPGPPDMSLESYKAWVLSLFKRLTTPDAELKLTESEWIERWEEYWRPRTGV
jgi:hypothetical protein